MQPVCSVVLVLCLVIFVHARWGPPPPPKWPPRRPGWPLHPPPPYEGQKPKDDSTTTTSKPETTTRKQGRVHTIRLLPLKQIRQQYMYTIHGTWIHYHIVTHQDKV